MSLRAGGALGGRVVGLVAVPERVLGEVRVQHELGGPVAAHAVARASRGYGEGRRLAGEVRWRVVPSRTGNGRNSRPSRTAACRTAALYCTVRYCTVMYRTGTGPLRAVSSQKGTKTTTECGLRCTSACGRPRGTASHITHRGTLSSMAGQHTGQHCSKRVEQRVGQRVGQHCGVHCSGAQAGAESRCTVSRCQPCDVVPGDAAMTPAFSK